MFLGEDILAWLVLAVGAAMAVGNGAALLRPRLVPRQQGDLPRAPVVRSLVFVVVGSAAALWALASLVFST